VAIVRIGERPSGPEREPDVVDSLLACHQRIRRFLTVAARVGAGGDPAAQVPQVIEACVQIARYFREAMPLHVADEEDSIRPRLAGRAREIDRALSDMHEQHSAHEAALVELTSAADSVAADPEDAAARARMAAAADALDAMLAPHLDLEEAVILPAIRRLLSARELADIALEIRARRGRSH
jgi:iron-sulfur cluster repair protein YtfE (RIC family)